MRLALVIGWNTYREWMREKFFWVAVALSFLLLSLSTVLGQLTFAEEQKILMDFGLSALEISLLFVASFSGAYVVSKEVDKQTCLLLLSRPISRTHFLLGKWIGLIELLLLLFATCSLVLWFLLDSQETSWFFLIAVSVFLKALVILSFTLMTSFFVRPIISLIFGVSIYLVGHWLSDLSYFAQKSHSQVYVFLADALGYIIPQFYRFNWKSYYFLEKGIDLVVYRSMGVHYLSWVLIYLFVADFLFRRKDIV
ncbi:MAG: ABC transporter permease [Bdellovibrionales bacterium]|nr:ABC transporter permease [Bdellovibrionales bacterium]